MKVFTASAWSSAVRRLRIAAPFSANDLVARTLARHGLSPESGVKVIEGAPTPGKIDRAMARLRPAGSQESPPSPTIPEGAEFLEDHFSCASGTRRYRTYVPASASAGATGVIVMLHGCTQTPEDFSVGTGMNGLAETHAFIAVYPHQSRGENAQSCWNWFRRSDQRRDKGEPAILAGLAQKVAAHHHVSHDRVFVAGLSAGAAMAVILGEAYPDVFAGVGAHSGLPVGSAKDVPSAFAAMAGNGTISASPSAALPVRTIIFHGTADSTVHPSNAEQIGRRVLNLGPREIIQTEERGQEGGRRYRRKVSAHGADPALVEEWSIEGLGHAWSGGSAKGSFTDTQGPDASRVMVRFFFDGIASEL